MAYYTEELSCIQISIVSSVRINIWQCTRKRHGTLRYYGIIRSSRNVGKLSACTNSGYQALFSDFSNGPGYEARRWHILLCDFLNYLSTFRLCLFNLPLSLRVLLSSMGSIKMKLLHWQTGKYGRVHIDKCRRYMHYQRIGYIYIIYIYRKMGWCLETRLGNGLNDLTFDLSHSAFVIKPPSTLILYTSYNSWVKWVRLEIRLKWNYIPLNLNHCYYEISCKNVGYWKWLV